MPSDTTVPDSFTTQPARDLRPWWARRWLPLAAVVFFIVMAWPFLRKQERGEWRVCANCRHQHPEK